MPGASLFAMQIERMRARLGDALVTVTDATSFLRRATAVLAEELGDRVIVVCGANLEPLATSSESPSVQRFDDDTFLIDGGPASAFALPAPSRARLLVAPPLDDPDALEPVVASLAAMEAHAREIERLANSERRLALAQELAHLGSYDWEIATDTNTWSDELFRIYGAEPGEFDPSYDTFMSFVHPDDRARIREIHRVAYETGDPYSMEERIVHRDGTERTLKSNGVVIHDASGQPVRMTGICWDITELKRAAETEQMLAEADEARRRSLEINDGIVQRLALASNALEHGNLRDAIRYVHDGLVEARRIAGDLLEQASQAGSHLDVLTRSEAAIPTSEMYPPYISTDLGVVRVLVADDTPGMRVLVREFLNADAGFQVVGEASTGYEALALAQDLRPHLIVLDLSMPELDGMQAIPELRRLVPDAPILVLSGYGGPMVDRAIAAGAADYVEKGTGFNDLVAKARRVVGLVTS